MRLPSGVELEEFDRFVATHRDPTAAFERVRSAFAEYVPAASCGPELELRVQQCVAQGRAASFVRLGDGEGDVLALELGEYPALTAYSLRAICLSQFGAPDVLLQAGPELQQSFRAAVRNADVIGIPWRPAMRWLLKRREDNPADPPSTYGTGIVYAYLERFAGELGLASKTGTWSGFNMPLLPHYRALIEGLDIGLVSCRESLPDALRRHMGARSVDFYPVPRQARPMMLRPRAGDNGHYPGRYRALLEELRNAKPGILYLVAAGVLGKVYCEAIRAAGGIALDIGAVADIWAGIRSRWTIPPETLETWRIV